VNLALLDNQLELGPQQGGDAWTVMTADRQPAAPFGTIGREGRHDEVSAAAYRLRGEAGIRFLVGRVGKKVADRPIVPKIDRRQREILRDVAYHPLDESGARPEPCLRVIQRRSGEVERDGLRIPSIEERVHEPRGTRPHVHDASLGPAEATEEP